MMPTFMLLFLVSACKHKQAADSDDNNVARTPVTICYVDIKTLSEYFELNATSKFQRRISVKATATGYVDSCLINIGDEVKEGQTLFVLKTKEASVLGNSFNKDSPFNFDGLIRIKSNKSGLISTLDHHKGDYVQDAEQLATIAEKSSLVFLVDVPYEMKKYLKTGGECEIILPDKEVIKGIVSSEFPVVEAVSQTESYIVQPINQLSIPENLIVHIRILKNKKEKAITLPKGSILTNETQKEFWVMKLINDSVAVKVPVKKGMENYESVEILEPELKDSTRIILEGGYGLSDTSNVMIQKAD